MRDDAMAIQRALDAETVEVEKSGVKVKITLAQRIVSIESNGKNDDDIANAINDAIKELPSDSEIFIDFKRISKRRIHVMNKSSLINDPCEQMRILHKIVKEFTAYA